MKGAFDEDTSQTPTVLKRDLSTVGKLTLEGFTLTSSPLLLRLDAIGSGDTCLPCSLPRGALKRPRLMFPDSMTDGAVGSASRCDDNTLEDNEEKDQLLSSQPALPAPNIPAVSEAAPNGKHLANEDLQAAPSKLTRYIYTALHPGTWPRRRNSSD